MEQMTVLAVVPVEGLMEILKEEGARHPELNIIYELGDLAQGVEVARQYENRDVDVIISRGGTARMIAKAVSTPVVSIQTSIYDLLRVLQIANNFSGNFAIVGFPNITANAEAAVMLLSHPVAVVSIKNEKEAEEAISRLHEQGVSLIVGDAIAVSTARKLHMNGLLISSGPESIANTFEEAALIARCLHRQYARCRMLEAVLSHSDAVHAVCDPEGEIVYQNQQVKQVLPDAVQRQMTALANSSPDGEPVSMLKETKNAAFRLKSWPCTIMHQPVTLFEVRQVLEASATVPMIRKMPLRSTEPVAAAATADHVGRMQQVYAQAAECGRQQAPVSLFMPEGTEDDMLIRAVFEAHGGSQRTVIDCDFSQATPKALEKLYTSETSYLHEMDQCLVFRSLEALGADQLQVLEQYIDQTLLYRRSKVVYLLTEQDLPQHTLHFLYTAGCTSLRVPPLCERTEDLPALIGLYINTLNMELGRNVTAIEPEGMAQMLRYAWPGNNAQLIHALRQMLTVSSGKAIASATVTEALRQLPAPERGLDVEGIKQMGTLDEINRQIIRMLMKDGSMKKGELATHLGISRSTLWRILDAETGTKSNNAGKAARQPDN